MRQLFNKSACTYDNFCSLQLQLIEKLLSYSYKDNVYSVLELGCGTGNLTLQLENFYKGANLIAVDYSPEMLAIAEKKCKSASFVLADIMDESFWSKLKCFDLIISNATLQWCLDLNKVFGYIAGHLNPEGRGIFSIFGPNTYRELSIVFGQDLTANRFAPLSKVKLSCQRYFDVVKFEIETIVKQYESLYALLKVIKNTGTRGRKGFFLTPSKLRYYEQKYYAIFGGIRASYEVAIFVVRRK